MKASGIINRVVGKQALLSSLKIGGGIYLYHLVSAQVDNPTYRWAIYGGLFLAGIRAPLLLAGIRKIWPAWTNLDDSSGVSFAPGQDVTNPNTATDTATLPLP